MSDPIRLSKLMSQRGLSSRREADQLITEGKVKVNGEVVTTLGVKFTSDVDIQLTQAGKQQQSERVTIMFNKPVGIVSGQAEENYQPAIRLIKASNQSKLDNSGKKLKSSHLLGLAAAGRLDIDSQGLLILTQDGSVAKRIIGERIKTEKEYLVRVNRQASTQQLAQLRHGLSLDGKKLQPAKVKQINQEQLQFILTEGKKRQIRRMCEMVGLHAYALKRVRIGQCRLGKLAEGEWRFVDAKEF